MYPDAPVSAQDELLAGIFDPARRCIECARKLAPLEPRWHLMESGSPGLRICVPCFDGRDASICGCGAKAAAGIDVRDEDTGRRVPMCEHCWTTDVYVDVHDSCGSADTGPCPSTVETSKGTPPITYGSLAGGSAQRDLLEVALRDAGYTNKTGRRTPTMLTLDSPVDVADLNIVIDVLDQQTRHRQVAPEISERTGRYKRQTPRRRFRTATVDALVERLRDCLGDSDAAFIVEPDDTSR